MFYIVWMDSGPRLVTSDLCRAVDKARNAIGRSQVSRFVLGAESNPFASVIYWRKPDKNTYVEHWLDDTSRNSYEHRRT
jgi:hypothetical protein